MRVAVPVPFLDELTYSVPEGMELPPRGSRVVVPLGTRTMTGIVIGSDAGDGARALAGETPDSRTPDALKPLAEVLDVEAFVPESVVDLACWVGEYYACGTGLAMAAAMPPRWAVRSRRRYVLTDTGRGWLSDSDSRGDGGPRAKMLQALASGRVPGSGDRRLLRQLEREGLVGLSRELTGQARAHRYVRLATLTLLGASLVEVRSAGGQEASMDRPEGALRLGAKQREALTLLAGAPTGLPVSQFEAAGVGPESLARLAHRGLIAFRRVQQDRDPMTALDLSAWSPSGDRAGEGDADRALTAEQTEALARLRDWSQARTFRAVLLHGVTGGGKTEVYLRLARDVVAGGRSVLVLVPEIALTLAVTAAFRTAFGDRVAIQHSALSDGERYDQWHRIRRGEVSVVVGTRSAVFAPLDHLGLIVVDEEHDASFKQEETPRYHGRDVAVVRGRQAGALVVLGSATPAMETFHNALAGRYERLTIERRVLGRPLAAVRIVNMREEYAEHGPDVILGQMLQEAVADRLARRQQGLLLLNRRGLATSVFCRQCAGTLECPNCSVALTVHSIRAGAGRREGAVSESRLRGRCHYCNYSRLVPTVCPACAGPYLERSGFGTARVEAEVRELWPEARVARLDRDTAGGRGQVVDLLSRFARRDLDLLVGTQMIAKGHDFPHVTLVGVVSADVGLGMADFRAAERTFQLLTQVAGRAGRGSVAGEAIVQTLYPDHYSIRHACRQDYAGFFDEEIRYRRAMRYPPTVALVNAVLRASTFEQAMAEASDLVSALRERGQGRYRVLGPAPAPLARLRGQYRVQWFLKGGARRVLREAMLEALGRHSAAAKRVAIDVDPLSVA